jgi:D-3-phosphoglycerate dehydrogenase
MEVSYYGDLSGSRTSMIMSAVLTGFFRPILESGVTLVNARAIAEERGIEVVESRSTRQRDYTNLISVKLHTSGTPRWVEGAVFHRGVPRLVLLDGVEIESALEGTMIVMCNNDQPGVIGDVGTILGRHGLNVATFALGRAGVGERAVGLVIVDETAPIPDVVLEELRRLPAVREARLVRV